MHVGKNAIVLKTWWNEIEEWQVLDKDSSIYYFLY